MNNNPSITTDELKDKLVRLKSHGVIDEITDTEINFIHKGDSKESPISGLRYRRHRMRKKTNQTN